ncbi:HAD family hydrolase [Portibacter marinus]|uniref:haloacid dehalogenase-like hydrolase n=1 Tax=Portibacter marinus TaxID=2898660 RepID=UPI001F23E2F7|nr:haloacid dehalogenase-like hydrolase [Portibacter marinus]
MSTSATRILREKVVLVFDFDGTLGPSTTEKLFDHLDLDYETFSEEVNSRMKDEMWQYALAKAEAFREWSHKDNSPLRKQSMEELGASYPLFDGVQDFIPRLKAHLQQKDEEIELEFVMLTAGFKTIPEASPIADHFDRIYGGELLFDTEGRILGAKRIITHVDKVHYIKQLKEGLDLDSPSELENTYIDHDPENDYVPMSQIIYVGDGASDMSAFQIVEKGGGIAIAIDPDKDEEWEGYDQMAEDRRVHNVASANYEEESELFKSLKLAIDRMTAEIKLLRFGVGE